MQICSNEEERSEGHWDLIPYCIIVRVSECVTILNIFEHIKLADKSYKSLFTNNRWKLYCLTRVRILLHRAIDLLVVEARDTAM
jgi:hypothetical protein